MANPERGDYTRAPADEALTGPGASAGSRIARAVKDDRRAMMARRRVATVGLFVAFAAAVTGLEAAESTSQPSTRPTPTLPADERLAAAVAEVGRFDFLKGYELFDQVLKSAQPTDSAWESATFGKAVCAQQTRPITEARTKEAAALYAELIQKRPQFPLAARAMMNLGRIDELRDHGEPPNLPGARRWYQQVIDRWPADPIAGEATLRLAATHVQTYESDAVGKGIALLEDWLEAHPDDALASAMWQYLGDTYFFPANDSSQALDCYE